MKLLITTKTLKYINGKTLISCILMLIGLIACDKEKVAYSISDEKFVKIISDIHISQSAVQHLTFGIRDSMLKVYLDQILEVHEMEKEIFVPEYEQLKRDPKKLEEIYGKIVIQLNEMKKIKKGDNKVEQKKSTKKR